MIQFCVSQQLNENPFIFRSTGTRVYSLEEALYHIFHHWRESSEDFLSQEMITWVSELGLPFVASKMSKIADNEHFTTRILDFLQLTDYFAPGELNVLKHDLEAWERRLEWEKLKERADYLTRRGDPHKALPIYKRAVQLEENIPLLNNIAVAYMQLSAPEEAFIYLSHAHALDPDNVSITLHYIEAAILSGEYESAAQGLEKAKFLAPGSADIQFLHGLMSYKQKRYTQALEYYEEAVNLAPATSHYVYKIADVYKTMRMYSKALDALTQVQNKDANFYVKEAEIHAIAGDIPASLKSMRNATEVDGANNANMWAKLAEYYRHDYDWRRAEDAISHALVLAPDNEKIRLESARIKKGLGRMRDYQGELTRILTSFKEQYRTDM